MRIGHSVTSVSLHRRSTMYLREYMSQLLISHVEQFRQPSLIYLSRFGRSSDVESVKSISGMRLHGCCSATLLGVSSCHVHSAHALLDLSSNIAGSPKWGALLSAIQ